MTTNCITRVCLASLSALALTANAWAQAELKTNDQALSEVENTKVKTHLKKAETGESRMKGFWDQAYEKEAYLFGTEPDGFFAEVLPSYKPGRILLPGEGEGRNAVFAAKLGWDVTAYDYSPAAKVKAQKLAVNNKVNIVYDIKDIKTANYPNGRFDAIAFLSIHFNQQDRQEIHSRLKQQLKSGGIFILHAFSVEHPKYNDKGPQTSEHLYSEADVLRDFADFEIIQMETVREYIKEGPSEMGDSSVFRFVGRKP